MQYMQVNYKESNKLSIPNSKVCIEERSLVGSEQEALALLARTAPLSGNCRSAKLA